MKYFCENCGMSLLDVDPESDSQFSGSGFHYHCPNCVCEDRLVEIPAYDTVAQGDKRKGMKYPATAPVYARFQGGGSPHAFN